jgi:hypothetical protein
MEDDDINTYPSYLITRIEVGNEERGKGYATQLLNEICMDADRERIRLWLEIAPDESNGLDYVQLLSWYKRHGFEQFMMEGIMVRDPQIGYTGATPPEHHVITAEISEPIRKIYEEARVIDSWLGEDNNANK